MELNMWTDIMIDCETLAITADACILSIGAVKFNQTEICSDGFYQNVVAKNQLDRVIDPDTLAWWRKQPAAAQEALKPNQIDLNEALHKLGAFFDHPNYKVWSNGASFDIPMLSHAWSHVLGTKLPWKFRNERCYRTMKNRPYALKWYGADAHNALDDAIAQTIHLQAILAAERKQVSLAAQMEEALANTRALNEPQT